MTNIKYILRNKGFETFENGINLEEIGIHVKSDDKFYIFLTGSTLEQILPDNPFFNEINGRGWLMKTENINNSNDRWTFLIIDDIEHGWYASHLYTGKVFQHLFDEYRRIKGEVIISNEEIQVGKIRDEFQFHLAHLGVEAKDTRKRILEPKQRIFYKSKKVKDDVDYFYRVVLNQEPPEKYKQLFFPDITLFYPKKPAEYVEIELSRHSTKETRDSFMKKLLKLQGTSRTVYFIFADNNFTHHIKLIREFELLSTRKFKSLYVCKMSDFEKRGVMFAFREFKSMPLPRKRKQKN
jgi:hypothetical protein